MDMYKEPAHIKVIQQSVNFRRNNIKTVKTAIFLSALFIGRFCLNSPLHHMIYNMSENHPESWENHNY